MERERSANDARRGGAFGACVRGGGGKAESGDEASMASCRQSEVRQAWQSANGKHAIA
jgi:hypothetical protein